MSYKIGHVYITRCYVDIILRVPRVNALYIAHTESDRFRSRQAHYYTHTLTVAFGRSAQSVKLP
jgi:hypothetical protein